MQEQQIKEKIKEGGMLPDTAKRPDETKLKEFMGNVINDLGATWRTCSSNNR